MLERPLCTRGRHDRGDGGLTQVEDTTKYAVKGRHTRYLPAPRASAAPTARSPGLGSCGVRLATRRHVTSDPATLTAKWIQLFQPCASLCMVQVIAGAGRPMAAAQQRASRSAPMVVALA